VLEEKTPEIRFYARGRYIKYKPRQRKATPLLVYNEAMSGLGREKRTTRLNKGGMTPKNKTKFVDCAASLSAVDIHGGNGHVETLFLSLHASTEETRAQDEQLV
jgi:hypothetical protein